MPGNGNGDPKSNYLHENIQVLTPELYYLHDNINFSMKKYEKGTLKVDRFVSNFSRALATENDPKNHEKV